MNKETEQIRDFLTQLERGVFPARNALPWFQKKVPLVLQTLQGKTLIENDLLKEILAIYGTDAKHHHHPIYRLKAIVDEKPPTG